MIRDRKVVAKLFDQVGPRYKDRPGGYTRIFKLGSRFGDNAALSQIELVEEEFTAKPKKAAPAEPVKASTAPKKAEPVKATSAETAPVEENSAE